MSTSAFGAHTSASAHAAGATTLHAADPLLLLGRALIGSIFVVSGYAKITALAAFAASLEKRGVPYASTLAVIGACVEFFGGLAIVLGIEVRYVAALMMTFVIVATLISHRFWDIQEAAARQAQVTQFSKNVAIVGGFVMLLAGGGGRYAVERLWRRG